MAEAAERGDVFSSFMNMGSLHYMLEGIGEETAIPEYSLMENYSPTDLKNNAEIFDDVLGRYLQEYRKAGIRPVHYPDSDAFVTGYLETGEDLG